MQVRAWGTYFDLNRAGEGMRLFRPLRGLRLTLPGLGLGETLFVVGRKPTDDSPAWNAAQQPGDE